MSRGHKHDPIYSLSINARFSVQFFFKKKIVMEKKIRQSDAVYDDDDSVSSRRRSLVLELVPLIFRPNRRGPEVGRRNLSRVPFPQGRLDECSPLTYQGRDQVATGMTQEPMRWQR